VSDDPLAAAADALAAGGLVCVPTETTYGLAADIRRREALGALIALKGRDPMAPFALIAADRGQARELAAMWPPAAERLAAAHWPGPLTLVIPARTGLPACLVGPGGGVGVRISSHPWPVELARRLGGPITATSANPSGAPPALDVAGARAYFGAAVACYLDDGAAEAGASTVVEVTASGRVRVLRPGPVVVQDADG
jgi:L-threonylcarbamoyladenylate synthase